MLRPVAGPNPFKRALFLIVFCLGCFGQVSVLTYHNDNARTGQNLGETILTPETVRATTFGKLLFVPMDGKVDAQPLYVRDVTGVAAGGTPVVYAATEHDTVYAFNAKSGNVYWKKSMLRPGETPSDDRDCRQVTPEIGITATPVIDVTAGPRGTIYLVAMSKDASGNYHQRLHALNLATGDEQFGGPKEITASIPGTGDGSNNGKVVFDPGQLKSRPGMLLLDGTVYTAWGSHCDIRPYSGWLIGFDRFTLEQNRVFNFAPNGHQAAVWAAGGGLAGDSDGSIFVNVANGTFDPDLNLQGFPAHGDYGNALVKLRVVNGQLRVVDYFTMSNTVSESMRDEDLGSGGVILFPNVRDVRGGLRHIGAGAGKDGHVYVFDRNHLGKFNGLDDLALHQQLPRSLGGGMYASPAWLSNSPLHGTIYFGATGDVIRAFTITNSWLSAKPTSSTPTAFVYPGATPAISASADASGQVHNAILWAVENSNPAILRAYDATNLGIEFYNSEQAASRRDRFGNGNKFITPTVADGRVIVGTSNGVAVFGLFGQP